MRISDWSSDVCSSDLRSRSPASPSTYGDGTRSQRDESARKSGKRAKSAPHVTIQQPPTTENRSYLAKWTSMLIHAKVSMLSLSKHETAEAPKGRKMPKLLTEEAVRRYREDGYCFPIRAMSAEDAASCRRNLEAYEASQRSAARRVGTEGVSTGKFRC